MRAVPLLLTLFSLFAIIRMTPCGGDSPAPPATQVTVVAPEPRHEVVYVAPPPPPHVTIMVPPPPSVTITAPSPGHIVVHDPGE